MGQTKEGSIKAMETIKKRYGVDENGKSLLHARIGAAGGRNGYTGGLYGDYERASKIGSIGGRRSKRGHKLIEVTDSTLIYRRKADGTLVSFDRRGVDGK